MLQLPALSTAGWWGGVGGCWPQPTAFGWSGGRDELWDGGGIPHTSTKNINSLKLCRKHRKALWPWGSHHMWLQSALYFWERIPHSWNQWRKLECHVFKKIKQVCTSMCATVQEPNHDMIYKTCAQVSAVQRVESQEITTTHIGPNGRVETPDEHDRRLAINAKMRFHRSLTSFLTACLNVWFSYMLWLL